MKRKILATLLAGLPCLAPAQSTLQNTTEWLRALSSEAAFDLTDDDPFTRPRLITERLDDGRTWLEFAADTLGSAAGGDPANPAAANEWARIDEAVTLLLTEAEKLKVEAALRQGTPGEADFNFARQKYLEGAARLMAFYKQAAAGRFDGTAGLLNPAALPDWETYS